MSNGATRGLKHKNINDFIREKVEKADRIRQEIENEALKEGITRLERGNKAMSESKHETQQEESPTNGTSFQILGFEDMCDEEKGAYYNEITEFLKPYLLDLELHGRTLGARKSGFEVVLTKLKQHFEAHKEEKERLMKIMNVNRLIVPYISLDLPGDIILTYNKLDEDDPLVAVFRLHPLLGEEVYRFGIFLDHYDTNKEVLCSLVWSTTDNMVVCLPMIGLNPYPTCWHCEKAFGTLSCGKCRVAKYCSKQCQIDSWKELGELLGRGATSAVFKGKDKEDGSIVAVKKISLAKMSKKQMSELAGELSLLQSFNHPNIVKIYAYEQNKKDLYFVLEYMENGSLRKTMQQLGSIPEELVAKYIGQALAGLAYIHQHNIIHRDIKGDNMLISKEGRVCLADFGLAKRIEADDSQQQEGEMDVAGTPYWLAPEVILMTAQTTASDIWSVGCTIIELLTGDPPYGKLSPMAAIFRMVQEDHPPLPKGISDACKEFLMKCFDKEVTTRSTAKSLLEHSWLSATTREEPLNISDMRKSISIYNRRPTVSLDESPNLSYLNFIVEEKDKQDIEQMNNEVKNITLSTNVFDEKNAKVLDIIDKLSDKLSLIYKRIQKRQQQEESLAKLANLYGKWLKDERENCEKQLKILQEHLFADLKTRQSLQLQIKRLKESIYEYARALEDRQPSGSMLGFKRDDAIFIISKKGDGTYFGEHVLSGKQGYFPSSVVQIIDKRERALTKRSDSHLSFSSSSNEQTLNEESINPVENAESVLQSIEAKSRKDKLGGFFGASGTEIDKGLRESQSRDNSPMPSRNKRGFSSMKNIFNKPVEEKESSNHSKRSGSVEGVEPDKQRVFQLLSDNPNLLQEGREWIRDGELTVKSTAENDKPKERHLFLFTDILVLTKRKNNKDKVKNIIYLEGARVILLGDDENFQNSFQINYKGVEYTFTSMLRNTEQASAERDSWWQSIKIQLREFQKRNFAKFGTTSH